MDPVLAIVTQDTWQEALQASERRINAFHNWEAHPKMEIVWRPAKSQRSLNQNALYWEWMEKLSEYFTKNGRPLKKDDAHDLMRHKFLGYDTKTIGQTNITQLRSTANLSATDMSHYMDQIDAWAAEMGCLLPTPADSAHERYLQSQERRGRG